MTYFIAGNTAVENARTCPRPLRSASPGQLPNAPQQPYDEPPPPQPPSPSALPDQQQHSRSDRALHHRAAGWPSASAAPSPSVRTRLTGDCRWRLAL